MDNNQVNKPVLRKQANWEDLFFYQKAVVLYQLTFVFTKRFLRRGDRTIDQMVQAARLGYRTNQREEIERLKRELEAANHRIAELEAKIAKRG